MWDPGPRTMPASLRTLESHGANEVEQEKSEMFTRRLLLQSGMATLLLDQLLNPLHAEAAPMIVVTPVKADLAANIGFNVKPEDFNTTQGPYATMWDSNPGVLTWLAQSKVRFARVGGGPPSGDSPAHKAEYFDRCREMVAQGIGLAAVVASTTGIANMDAIIKTCRAAGSSLKVKMSQHHV